MTRLYDELHAAEEHINSLKTKEAQDEYEESVLKAIEDKIAELKSAFGKKLSLVVPSPVSSRLTQS